MRLLILLCALVSAFFMSKSNAAIDYTSLKTPKGVMADCAAAHFPGSGDKLQFKVCTPYGDAKKMSCDALASSVPAGSSTEYTWTAGGTCQLRNGSYEVVQEGTRHYSSGTNLATTRTLNVWFANITDELTYECPPDGSPEHTIPVETPTLGLMCAKNFDAFNNCPEPSEGDFFTGGVGSQSTKCFANPDGTQCKIETGEDGSYMLPASYGSSEPEICREAPYEPVAKTPSTAPRPEPKPTDAAPEIEDIDAINKVNENLDAMNTNQTEASTSNDALLERIVGELQIGNAVSGEIRDQPSNFTGLPFTPTDGSSGTGGTGGDNSGGGSIGEGPCTGDDCAPCTGDDCSECTGDDCEESNDDDFSISGARKSGGLNDIFTADQLAEVTSEIEEKNTELLDYIETIKLESKNIFDVDPHLTGGYEEKKVSKLPVRQ